MYKVAGIKGLPFSSTFSSDFYSIAYVHFSDLLNNMPAIQIPEAL